MWTSEENVHDRSAAPAHLYVALSGIAQAGVKAHHQDGRLYSLSGYITVTKIE